MMSGATSSVSVRVSSRQAESKGVLEGFGKQETPIFIIILLIYFAENDSTRSM